MDETCGRLQRSAVHSSTRCFLRVSGPAQSFSQALGDTYQAGLWQGNLCCELLWEMSDAELLRDDYRPHAESLPSLLAHLKAAKTCYSPFRSWVSRPAKITYYHCKGLKEDHFHQEVLSLDSRTTCHRFKSFWRGLCWHNMPASKSNATRTRS
jgi:hypothetical protein